MPRLPEASRSVRTLAVLLFGVLARRPVRPSTEMRSIEVAQEHLVRHGLAVSMSPRTTGQTPYGAAIG